MQPKIIELAQTWLKVAKDNAELAEFDIGTKFVSTFEGEIANAQTFKTDKQIVKETAALTEKKNSKLKECSKWMKQVKIFYDKLFKANSAESKLFPQNLANEINNAGRQKFADNPEKILLFDSPWPSTPLPKKSAIQNPTPEPAK